MTDKGLGRRFAPDARDYGYLLRQIAPVTLPRRTKHWPMFFKPLDQLRTGTCVGHGWKHWMLTAPTIQTKPAAEPTALTIYREACALDPWSENDGGDLQFGTSVRAAAQALQKRGLIGTYGWAFTADDAINWLCNKGPLVGGFNWYRGMSTKDKNGFIHATGPLDGGHCVCLTGWNEERGAATGPNSWGDWGRFWMTGELLERLMHENGEGVTAVEVRG